MKNAIKKGFGLVIGQELAKFAIFMVVSIIAARLAKNEGYMNNVKETDPELFDFIIKLAKKTKEAE